MNEKKELQALASSATANKGKYNYDSPDKSVLETFDNPASSEEVNQHGAELTIAITAPEFTTLCPITGQPDFATIKVEYRPDKLCMESKSFKLYLLGYRNFGTFHEACVTMICNDLVDALQPLWLKVVGEFTPRGGIPFWPTAEYTRHSEE